VATVLTEEHEDAMHAAQVPPSGAVWYRAQLRVRQDAARAVRRIINVVQVAAVVIALIAVFLIVRAGSAGHPLTLPLILALATPVLFTPVALYFALTED